jgi:hypothetical protein
MAHPATVQQGLLVVFDLIACHDQWNAQNLFEHIVNRLAEHNIDPSSFPSRISVQNLAKQRSLFNKTSYRNKTKLACSKYRQEIGCENGSNLFDFFYPPTALPQEPAPPADPRRNDKRKIDTLQKSLRRWKAKCELLKRKYIQLSKTLGAATKKAQGSRLTMAKKLKNAKRQSQLKTVTNSSQRKTIAAMRKALNKCVQMVSRKQKKQMKAMMGSRAAEFVGDYDITDEEGDDPDDSDAKCLRLLVIAKQQRVNREAVRNFCKAFDDIDVNASRLESKWKQCRKDVINRYQLEVSSKVAVDKNGAERVYVFVADFDNYLTQIIALEGLPSTANGDSGERQLWLRIGGDGRSIHRHSNNILIVMALMDTVNPRRSHSPLFVHTMMLIDGNESHDLLMDALRVIDEWIHRLTSNGFMYDEHLMKVNIVLSGDMKFIQLVKGLQGSTSVYSCPLCLKPKQPKMPSKGPRPWGGYRCACDTYGDEECEHWRGAGVYRTQAHASQLADAGGDCWSHMGHHKQAPLKSVEWNLIILDTLHGLLRITDVIFGSLYEWARRSCDPLNKDSLLKVNKIGTNLLEYLN